jgi:hypothetical protein
MALNAARSCAFGFYMPAAQGLLPQTVTADQLASANAGRRLGLNGAQIAGAALGGIVVGLAGPGWGLVADAASYVLAGAMRAGMRFSRLPPMASTSMLQELRARRSVNDRNDHSAMSPAGKSAQARPSNRAPQGEPRRRAGRRRSGPGRPARRNGSRRSVPCPRRA